jgi:hypothetical protein
MAKFVLVYVGGEPPEDQRDENMKDWGTWIQELQDKKVYVAGDAFGWTKKVVESDGSVSDYSGKSSGYSVIEAGSMDEAIEVAKSGPVGKYGGSTEVFDVMVIPGM